MTASIEREEARRRLAALQLPSEAHRLVAEPCFWHESVLQELFELSDEWVFVEPKKALSLGEVLPRLADRIPREGCEGGRAHALKAMALCRYGTTLRGVGELESARLCYLLAGFYLHDEGTPRERAELNLRRATLEGCSKRFNKALALATSAVETWRHDTEDRHMLGRALLTRTSILIDSGDAQGAIEELAAAFSHLDPARCPRLYYAALHTRSYIEATVATTPEELSAASEALARTRAELQWGPESLPQAKTLWIEGRIRIRLGEPRRALGLMQAAYAGLERQGARADLILLALDIAELLEQQGLAGQLRRHCARMFPLLAIARACPRAYEAMVRFQKAASRGSLTSTLISDVRGKIVASTLAA